MIQTFIFSLIAAVSLHQNNGPSAKPVIKKVIIEDPKCFNVSSGSAEVIVEGGTPPYAYSLDGNFFQSSSIFTRLQAGNYRVFIKDSKANVATSTFKVFQAAKISFLPTRVTNSSCCEPNGAVLVQAQGGNGHFEYQINESPFQPTGYFKGLSGGYTVVARDSMGCKASIVVKVDDLNKPVIDFLNSTEVTCYNGNNGSINIYSIGGNGNLRYSVDGTHWQPEPVFKELKAGTYLARVKDETGCRDSLSIVITQPHQLEIDAWFTATNGNSATVAVKYSIGGTGPHCYSLNGKDYQSDPLFKINHTQDIIYVKDVAGCIISSKISGNHLSMKEQR